MRRDHMIEAGGAVGVRLKTRLRARDKMEPTERQREGIDRAREVHYERPIPPNVMVAYDEESGRWDLTAPHRDVDGWEVQVCEAFATRSHAVMWSFLLTLAEMVGREWKEEANGKNGRWQPDEYALNFALNVIHAEQPETPMQAMLCAQMVATHMMQMKTAKRAIETSYDDRIAAISGKLARTFAIQMDTLRRAKGKVPTQHIQVSYERHVHHHQHVHMEGGSDNFGGQPQTANGNRHSDSNQTSDRQARRLSSPDRAEVVELEGRATVLGEDKAGNALPGGSGKGEAPMQASRVRARGGRAEG